MPGWAIYIKYATGVHGWLCKTHYNQFAREGYLYPKGECNHTT